MRMTPIEDDVQRARDRFAAWLRWYRDKVPKEVPSQNALARKLGLAGPTLTYLLEAGATREPSFTTLVKARKLLLMPIDAMLYSDPPSTPKK